MRMTMVPQKVTNSVAQFMRIVTKILAPHLREKTRHFVNNIVVKRPKTLYDNEKVAPGIYQYIIQHIQSLDAVLADLERT